MYLGCSELARCPPVLPEAAWLPSGPLPWTWLFPYVPWVEQHSQGLSEGHRCHWLNQQRSLQMKRPMRPQGRGGPSALPISAHAHQAFGLNTVGEGTLLSPPGGLATPCLCPPELDGLMCTRLGKDSRPCLPTWLCRGCAVCPGADSSRPGPGSPHHGSERLHRPPTWPLGSFLEGTPSPEEAAGRQLKCVSSGLLLRSHVCRPRT